MRSISTAPRGLAALDAITLRELRDSAHFSYARCPDAVAERLAESVIHLELEMIRRHLRTEAPPEADVPLAWLSDTGRRRANALERIRRSAGNGDAETFRDSVYYLAPEDVREAWQRAYAFQGDLRDLNEVLTAVFLTAFTHREGSAAACAAHERLLTRRSVTSYLIALEHALCPLLGNPAPYHAIISALGRWRAPVTTEE